VLLYRHGREEGSGGRVTRHVAGRPERPQGLGEVGRKQLPRWMSCIRQRIAPKWAAAHRSVRMSSSRSNALHAWHGPGALAALTRGATMTALVCIALEGRDAASGL
jgi:hypothetical protein